MTQYTVWYMRPSFFVRGILGETPNYAKLGETHIMLRTVEAASLGAVSDHMQAERWSPNGEARSLIEGKGLGHTSMSVGDVIVEESGAAHVVGMVGFRPLSRAST